MPVQPGPPSVAWRPDEILRGHFGKWSIEMIEVVRSGAIIMMGLSVMGAAVRNQSDGP